MATAETIPKTQDKVSRLKPFAWMKRLASRKYSSSDRGRSPSKKTSNTSPSKSKTSPPKFKPSLPPQEKDRTLGSASRGETPFVQSRDQPNGSYPSLPRTADEDQAPAENKSIAPTLETNPGTIHSEGDHHSKAGTSNTAGGGMSSASGGANSIFSSSNHSSHSLTTTLTTIQSTPTGNVLNQQTTQGSGAQPATSGQPSSHQTQPSQSSSYFQHQYPTTPIVPASAIPSHLNPHTHQPTTYRSATANNLLTDNASVITLASSSNRQVRRNSLDTNASIRAIAPSSVWGGSRESLPLSVLSQSTNEQAVGTASTTGVSVSQSTVPASSTSSTTTSTAQQQQHQNRPQSGLSGLIPAERASVYSSGGVAAPVLSSERNSIYAGKDKPGIDGASLKGGQGQDTSSIRSGLAGHGRSESITGSIGGYSSALASPKESMADGDKGF